jgi:hypothetical protein
MNRILFNCPYGTQKVCSNSLDGGAPSPRKPLLVFETQLRESFVNGYWLFVILGASKNNQ